MLRCTIELLPGGDESRARTIGVVEIANVGGTREVGNHQLVPLLGPAWDLVQSAPVLGEFILPYNTESMIAAFERARDRIAATGMPGIKDLRFHDLRRTGATRLLKMGLPIPEVCMITGHSNWQQLKRYCALSPEDVHQAYDALTA